MKDCVFETSTNRLSLSFHFMNTPYDDMGPKCSRVYDKFGKRVQESVYYWIVSKHKILNPCIETILMICVSTKMDLINLSYNRF